ncbi:MAG: DUF2442 domain-containing protein [Propionibacteriaceae bacterium]|nr:DUF2442 domain-containing protein [Propionibacteriaceae bacterium]
MKTSDDVVYADDFSPEILVETAAVADDHHLRVTFSDGAAVIFDMEPFLRFPLFAPLRDPSIFASVSVSGGVPTWCDGSIDIAPETLRAQGIPQE